ncbi:MAG: hypothetical protein FJ405_12965 [Verrucomicrobia bacterium]|nr:hypothetical protein [Verrucomicrobiota bacterium]
MSDTKTVTYTGQGNFTIGSESMFKAKDTGFIAQGGNMTVSSLEGDVELQGVRVRAAAEATATVISHRKDVELVGGEISGREIMIKGIDKVMLNAVDFVFTGNPVSSLLAIESRTLVLHNIDLPADRPVRLKSELGLLAKNPNTRAATRNGYVNYYFGVTSGGVPAELLTVGSGVGVLPDAQRHITTLPISPGQ